MSRLIIETIEGRAKLHGGDVNKAAEEHFQDCPEDWQHYRDEVTGAKKRVSEDRERVNGEMEYQIQMVAHRDNLDLSKPTDRVVAQEKVVAEKPNLYKRYGAANTIHIGKVSAALTEKT